MEEWWFGMNHELTFSARSPVLQNSGWLVCAAVLSCSHLLLIVAIGIAHVILATQCKACPTMLCIRLVIYMPSYASHDTPLRTTAKSFHTFHPFPNHTWYIARRSEGLVWTTSWPFLPVHRCCSLYSERTDLIRERSRDPLRLVSPRLLCDMSAFGATGICLACHCFPLFHELSPTSLAIVLRLRCIDRNRISCPRGAALCQSPYWE